MSKIQIARRAYELLLDQMPDRDLTYLVVDPLMEDLINYKHFCRSEMNINFSSADIDFLGYLKLFSKVRKKDKRMIQLARHNFYCGTWEDFKKIEYPKYKPNAFMKKSWGLADRFFDAEHRLGEKYIFVTTDKGDFFFKHLPEDGFYGETSKKYLTLFVSPGRWNVPYSAFADDETMISGVKNEDKENLQVSYKNLNNLNDLLFGSILAPSVWPLIFSKSVNYTLSNLYSPLDTIKFYQRILPEAEVNLTNSKINLLKILSNQSDQIEALKNKVASSEVFEHNQEEKWSNIEKNYTFDSWDAETALASYKEAELDVFALKHHIERLRLKHNLSNPNNPI